MQKRTVHSESSHLGFRFSFEKLRYFYHPDHASALLSTGLGSTSWVTDSAKNGVQYCEYLLYGEPFLDQRSTTWNSRYTFAGKERDNETGYSYFGARYYNSDVSIWLSVDPLSDKYPNLSAYAYCANNPVNRIDLIGMSDSPIYDTDGNFLGTDDEGLQGDAIVMKRSDFKQGMSHKEALSKSTDLNTNNREEAEMKMNIHYSGLKNRPDYDGYLTLDEANDWYRNGNGQPLYVDASKIDLSPVQKSDFSKVGDSFYNNFAFTTNTETGFVYGNIRLTLMNDKGDIKLGGTGGFLDKYNFDYKKGVTNIPRNIATWIGEQKAGKGTSYNIFCYGIGKVK